RHVVTAPPVILVTLTPIPRWHAVRPVPHARVDASEALQASADLSPLVRPCSPLLAHARPARCVRPSITPPAHASSERAKPGGSAAFTQPTGSTFSHTPPRSALP